MESIHSHGHRHSNEDMLSVEEAFDRILKAFQPLNAESKPILETVGQILHGDVKSPIDIPPLDNSGMDGYAVLFDDIQGADEKNPITLEIIDTVPAGQISTKQIATGTTIRIMTGAPVPNGADTVIPFEETDEISRITTSSHLSHVSIMSELPKHANIRPAGEDVKCGQVVLESGTAIRPAEVGVLASLGVSSTNVIRRPIVSVLSTGDELEELDQELRKGHIYDSNTYSIASSISAAGGIPNILGIARDNIQDLESMLSLAASSDLLITSAGVSKGDYDLVKDVLMNNGDMNFWSVCMRPAKPLAFGILRPLEDSCLPLIGLPGNPVSAMVAFEMFARPAIRKMLGFKTLHRPRVNGILTSPIYNHDGRRVYARVEVTSKEGIYYASPTGPQGSNILTSMTRANGLAICPEDIEKKDSGETVEIVMIDRNEEGE